MSMAAKARGAYGERRAAEWYQREGYEVLDRNWRTRTGELDLVVRRGDEVVMVEVKARASDAFGSPAEAVTTAKAGRIRRLALQWVEAHGLRGVRLRFDVVTVVGVELEVIEAAF